VTFDTSEVADPSLEATVTARGSEYIIQAVEERSASLVTVRAEYSTSGHKTRPDYHGAH